MSWAGLERYERIVRLGLAKGDALEAAQMRDKAAALLEASARSGILTNAKEEDVTDSSLCLLSTLRYPNANLVEGTLRAIESELRLNDKDGNPTAFFFRYRYKDDFGNPVYPFLVCSFWYIEALSRSGENEKASQLLVEIGKAANHLGLFSEHFDQAKGMQTGNFPQCYSHVGLIHCAFAVSEPWENVL
jgi:GH15 family glucan-1,4-alpha-glucosidase